MLRLLALLTTFATACPSPVLADQDRDRDRRLGVSIWGLSYHVDDEVDIDEANIGLGLRYYFTQRPVPRIPLGCGRMKTNAIVVLRGDSPPVAVIAASLTIMLR